MASALRVCVTGAAGFVASWLVRELLEKGVLVRGTVRRVASADHLRALPRAVERLELVEADLTVPGSFEAAVRGCTVVFHTASPYVIQVVDPQRDLVAPAVIGTRDVLRACVKASDVARAMYPDYLEERAALAAPKGDSSWLGLRRVKSVKAKVPAAETSTAIPVRGINSDLPVRFAPNGGAVPGDRFVQVGLRGYWPPAETFAWMKEQGMVWHTMHEIWERGFKAVMADAVAEALDKADHLYLSVDVDVMDPAHAPGTGTPEPGGMTSVDLLRMVRQLALEHDLVGMDVVEVAPAYDVSDLTVNAAHRLVFEALAGMAERRRRATEGD